MRASKVLCWMAGDLELGGVLNLIKVDCALIGEVVEDIACLLSLLATLLEPERKKRKSYAN